MKKRTVKYTKSLGESLSEAFLVISFLLCSFLPFSLEATSYYEYSPLAEAAYREALNLRFGAAQEKIQQLRREEPDNLVVYHIENYIDFFRILINENEAEFKRLERQKAYRLEQISRGDPSSPYHDYIQAELKLQWALSRLKFEEYFTAFGEIRSAYKLLTKNKKRFPDFVPNQKSLGILHAMIGTVPDNYRWGLKLLGGMEGSIEQGRKEIESVLRYAQTAPFLFEEETAVLYAMLLLHLKNQREDAWTMIQSVGLDPAQSPLACFVLANIAMHTGHNDKAIQVLNKRPNVAGQHSFYYLDYMLGLAKLYRQDKDADHYFQQYLKHFKGKNYIKEAYQKLAWYELLEGNISGYNQMIRECLTKGEASIGGDKQALNEARSGRRPHSQLLLARLLFDGGYYERAYRVLDKLAPDELTSKRNQIEYYYRKGRISHRLDKEQEALENYTKTIELGRYEKAYFACNAALQVGLLLERKSRYPQAAQYYQRCLAMHPEEYANGLHQKAKAGLNRLPN